MINKRRAFIVGIKSLQLSKNEIDFLKRYKPWGVILFLRNIQSYIFLTIYQMLSVLKLFLIIIQIQVIYLLNQNLEAILFIK